MRKGGKIALIVATCLVLAGIACMIGAAAAVGFDVRKLSTIKFVDETVTVSEDFDTISVDVTSADIELKLSDDKKCRVDFHEREKVGYSASVKNKTLTVKENDDRKWFEQFGISFERPKITLFLPKIQYDALAIKTVSGNISIPKAFTFGRLSIEGTSSDVKCEANVKGDFEIKLVTGDVKLDGVKADTLDISATTGDVKLRNVRVKKSLNIRLTTGDVRFDESDGGEITVVTTTGDVTGTLLSDKVISAQTTTGDIRVPRMSTGGRCEITTVTGDIVIDIAVTIE